MPVRELPELLHGEPEAPAHAAWLRYLNALANDGDCAMAASLAYSSLPLPARIAWVDALEEDAPQLDVEPFALYAPLLAVEHDMGLAARIRDAMGDPPPVHVIARALRGVDAKDGTKIAVLVRPAYMDFADLVACRYSVDEGISLAVRDPLRHNEELPSTWDGVALVEALLGDVIEDLAHAVLADRRRGRPPPEALVPFAELFGARGT